MAGALSGWTGTYTSVVRQQVQLYRGTQPHSTESNMTIKIVGFSQLQTAASVNRGAHKNKNKASSIRFAEVCFCFRRHHRQFVVSVTIANLTCLLHPNPNPRSLHFFDAVVLPSKLILVISQPAAIRLRDKTKTRDADKMAE